MKMKIKDFNNSDSGAPVHRGSSSICLVSVIDLAIDMHFFGVIGFPMYENYFLGCSLDMSSHKCLY